MIISMVSKAKRFAAKYKKMVADGDPEAKEKLDKMLEGQWRTVRVYTYRYAGLKND